MESAALCWFCPTCALPFPWRILLKWDKPLAAHSHLFPFAASNTLLDHEHRLLPDPVAGSRLKHPAFGSASPRQASQLLPNQSSKSRLNQCTRLKIKRSSAKRCRGNLNELDQWGVRIKTCADQGSGLSNPLFVLTSRCSCLVWWANHIPPDQSTDFLMPGYLWRTIIRLRKIAALGSIAVISAS